MNPLSFAEPQVDFPDNGHDGQQVRGEDAPGRVGREEREQAVRAEAGDEEREGELFDVLVPAVPVDGRQRAGYHEIDHEVAEFEEARYDGA